MNKITWLEAFSYIGISLEWLNWRCWPKNIWSGERLHTRPPQRERVELRATIITSKRNNKPRNSDNRRLLLIVCQTSSQTPDKHILRKKCNSNIYACKSSKSNVRLREIGRWSNYAVLPTHWVNHNVMHLYMYMYWINIKRTRQFAFKRQLF